MAQQPTTSTFASSTLWRCGDSHAACPPSRSPCSYSCDPRALCERFFGPPAVSAPPGIARPPSCHGPQCFAMRGRLASRGPRVIYGPATVEKRLEWARPPGRNASAGHHREQVLRPCVCAHLSPCRHMLRLQTLLPTSHAVPQLAQLFLGGYILPPYPCVILYENDVQ